MAILCHPLTRDTIVYRAILKKSYINKNVDQWRQVLPGAFIGAILPLAFKPREKDGASREKGISLFLADRDPKLFSEVCGLDNHGTASLHVGRMRDIDLEVIHDLDVENEHCRGLNRLHHCAVEGIPEWEKEEQEALKLAEDIADLLSQQAFLRYNKTNIRPSS